jgi:ubiquinone/menaquinone biosynthesis C-methylase UbiE
MFLKGATRMTWLADFLHGKQDEASVPQTQGLVWRGAWFYDLTSRVLTRLYLGRSEQELRHMIADLAQLQPGEVVLDVGCGTGTLAIITKQRVGATGRVFGTDPAVGQIAEASRKAKRAGQAIDFQVGVIERIAFPDQSFDAVLSTFMMHHLPDSLKRQGLAEIARVLKPGGRLLVVDAKRPEEGKRRLLFGQQIGPWNSGIQDQAALMKEAGFSPVEAGETRFQRIGFARARKSLADEAMAAQ